MKKFDIFNVPVLCPVGVAPSVDSNKPVFFASWRNDGNGYWSNSSSSWKNSDGWSNSTSSWKNEGFGRWSNSSSGWRNSDGWSNSSSNWRNSGGWSNSSGK